MAITTQNPWQDCEEEDYMGTMSIQDFAIGGKLVSASVVIDQMEAVKFKGDQDFKKVMKRRLVAELVDFMIMNNLVETTFENNYAAGSIALRARCYLAPSGDVKILRTHT